MPLEPSILALLVCPETHQPLAMAPADVLTELNARIADGAVRDRSGKPVAEPLTEGLIRADRGCVYRVDGGIPNLLVDDRIDL